MTTFAPGRPQTPLHSDEVDWVVVHRLTTGQPVRQRPTTAELTDAVRQLTDRGVGVDEIAKRMGVSTRCVDRHRAKIAAAR